MVLDNRRYCEIVRQTKRELSRVSDKTYAYIHSRFKSLIDRISCGFKK